jgi:hypothetical protein
VRFDWDIHPDDVIIDLETGEVMLAGPTSIEERALHKMLLDSLDQTILMAEESAELIRENPKLRNERKRLGLLVTLIDRVNNMLAPHWQKPCDPKLCGLAIMPTVGGGAEGEAKGSLLP